jgi:hypothetical protein
MRVHTGVQLTGMFAMLVLPTVELPFSDHMGFPQENSTIAAINGFSGSNYLNEAHTSLMDGRNM